MAARHFIRLLALLAVGVCIGSGPAAAQKFYPDDPLLREPTPLPAPDPGSRNLSMLLEAASGTLGRDGERHPGKKVIAAQDVNTLGDVLDGAWYVNRHGRTRMSVAELQRGSGNDQPSSMQGPWQVLLLKNQAQRPTLIFQDSNDRIYLLIFDSRNAPELSTGAEMISARFFHALGYHVPETYLTVFRRDQLVVETNASDVTSNAEVRQLLPERIDRLLADVARQGDDRYRAVALRVPIDGVSLIGPYQMYGTRSDDPNDVVPHEHRRDLRGLQVFSALAEPHPHGRAPYHRHRRPSRTGSRRTSAITCTTSRRRWAAA
jgi:hypothetical protein